MADIERFNAWAEKLKRVPKKAPDGEYEGILVSPKGVVMFVEGGAAWRAAVPFAATGSGRDAAYGALHMGATAVEAVVVAIKVDNGSGLPVTYVSIKE